MLQTLGFTPNEQRVILFLVTALVLGIGVRSYQHFFAPLPPLSVNIPQKQSPVIQDEPETGSVQEKPEPRVQSTKMDLNHATQEELITIPGIGPALAKRIIDYRNHNSVQSIDDLQHVKGIGKKKCEQLNAFLSIEPERREKNAK